MRLVVFLMRSSCIYELVMHIFKLHLHYPLVKQCSIYSELLAIRLNTFQMGIVYGYQITPFILNATNVLTSCCFLFYYTLHKISTAARSHSLCQDMLLVHPPEFHL